MRAAASGKRVACLAGRGSLPNVAFSSDGRILVCAGDSPNWWEVDAWDTRTWRPIVVPRRRMNRVSALAFSREGRLLALGHYGGTLRIWDAATWRELHVVHEHTGHVTGIAFSHDSRLIATAAWDDTVRLWDARTAANSRASRATSIA